jgi:hypothetical protein
MCRKMPTHCGPVGGRGTPIQKGSVINPRLKPRPALILAVFDDDAPQVTVRVAYGATPHRGEFSILRDRHASAYEGAGLSDQYGNTATITLSGVCLPRPAARSKGSQAEDLLPSR